MGARVGVLTIEFVNTPPLAKALTLLPCSALMICCRPLAVRVAPSLIALLMTASAEVALELTASSLASMADSRVLASAW